MRFFRSWVIAAAASAAPAAAVAQSLPATLQACVQITRDNERLACFDREIAALSPSHASGAATAHPAAAAPPPTATNAPAAPAHAAAVSTGAVAASAPAPAASAPPRAAAASTPASSAAVAAGVTTAGAAVASLTPEQEFGLSAEGIRKVEARQGVRSAAALSPKELTAHIAGLSRNLAGRQLFTLDNGQVWRQTETKPSFEAHAGDAVKISPGAFGSFWLSTDTHNQTRVERLP